VIATATTVAGDKEGNCDGGKSIGDGNKGGGQATATAMVTKTVIATATTVAGDKEGNCDGGKSIGDGNKGGGQAN
jgi:hypothetical protein